MEPKDANRPVVKARILKRPFLHHLIVLGYLAAPAANVALLAVAFDRPVARVLRDLFAYFSPLGGLLVVTAPVVALGLYLVHRLSWYLFLAHAVLLLADLTYKLAHLPSSFYVALLVTDAVLLSIIGYILQKDFRAPYFQVLPRGWRETRRAPIDHVVEIDGRSLRATDISASGCFVVDAGPALRLGQVVAFHLSTDEFDVTCSGEVVRITPRGHGIRFMRVDAAARRSLDELVKNRYPLRYAVEIRARWRDAQGHRDGTLFNISSDGCFLHMDIGGLEPGSAGQLEVRIKEKDYEIPARVVWLNRSGQYGKPIGAGMRFDSPQRGAVRHLRHPLRYSVDLKASWIVEGQEHRFATIVNLSTDGAFLQIDVGGLTAGMEGHLHFTLGKRTLTLPATITWVNETNHPMRPAGIGLQFRERQRGLPRLLRKYTEATPLSR